GPVSFMRAADASAGVIKSGGKTRRAAKMVVLNADHPDVVEFIRCKADEERKAWALIAAGYDRSLDGPAYGSIFFQNANNSVRVTDEFMRAALEGRPWSTRFVTSGEVAETMPARTILRLIAEATHQCGDPGMQFDTTINDWHTCPNTGRINASNPCSEYMHLDDSACNLASLNLMQFVDASDVFDVAAFRHAVDIAITAQDIVVDRSSYPTSEIAANAHAYRELGLGYANLGALLMSLGLPYDSDTTGVEPDIALVKYKKLVGGGVLKIVNTTVPRALRRLGYDSREVQEIVEYIDEHETIEGAQALRPELLPVFDCAFRPARGSRSIHPLGHI